MLPSSVPLDDVTLAFLDVETTGLSPRLGDRICEIAILRTHGDQVQTTFQSLVNPQRPISPDAARVNHLSDRDLCDAPLFRDIADTILDVLHDNVLVCHNAPFDLGFVGTEMYYAGKSFGSRTVIDTVQLARRNFRFSSNSLPNVAAALGIPTPSAHRALGDVLTTRAVYECFVRELRKRGVRTLGALLRAQGGNAWGAVSQEISVPQAIVDALNSGRRLFVKYLDKSGEVTERWVTIEQVTGWGNSITVVGFCHMRQETRNFRLDRIIDMRVETK